jgi:transglutaminase-like putative cysteine protease
MKLLPAALLSTALYGATVDVPDWVRQAAAQTVPQYPAKVFAASLLQEESVTVDPDGRRVMRERGVIKILQKSTDEIRAYRSYNSKTGRIRDFRGWLLPVTGAAVALGKEKVADIALSSDSMYDEGRAKTMSPGTGLPPGSVFAYEVTEEEKTVFTQYSYAFQESLPVLVSRFVLAAPAGWEVRGALFNHEPLEPASAGGAYTWELHNLPWIEDERYSPELHAVAPRLGVTYFPGDNKAGLHDLRDWRSVSAWVADLVDPPAEVSEPVRAKSAELTRGLAGEADKIRAIARFVQQVNYVSVQLNETRGGGFTPHRADQILTHNYGDCKDKATLMRALLQAAGIGSYLTLIYATDPEYVRPEWASPHQFNHAIVAVRVSPETALPTVFEHPNLGRLLMFDPTDSDTPMGGLPREEQGSHALVVAGARGELVEMPLLAANTNRVESLAEASMDAAGKLEVHVGRQYFGQSAAQAHARVAHQSGDELKRSYERSLGRRVGAIAVRQANISGVIAEGQMQLSLDFTADHFSQIMPGLMIVKPGALALGADYAFIPGERKLPVKLTADVYKDSVRIKLPAGYKVDEMPDAVHLDSAYGTYNASWKADGGVLVFEQSTEVRDSLVPAAQYPELRAFFDKIGGSQVAPVVLASK